MARKSWYVRNARVPSHPAGMDPFAHLGRKRTPAGSRQRRESVAYNLPGAQVEGSAGGGGTTRGDAGFWKRKKGYASAKRQQSKSSGTQVGSPSGTAGRPSRRRRRR